jgi:hypothetical protein
MTSGVIKGVLALLLISALAAGMMVAGCGEKKTADTGSGDSGGEKAYDVVDVPVDPMVPQPTDALPPQYEVHTGVKKDPITGEITVTVQGGAGMGLLTQIEARSTCENQEGKSIWWVVENPTVGQEIKLGGVKDGSDRVEILLTYQNGHTYRVYDDVLAGRDLSSAGGSSSGGGC